MFYEADATRKASGGKEFGTASAKGRGMLGSVTIHRLLGKMQEVNASDLHIKIGSPPVLRINSHLHRVESGDLTADDTSKLLAPIIPAHLKPQLEEKGGVDYSHMEGPTERFRIALFQAGGGLHAAIKAHKA